VNDVEFGPLLALGALIAGILGAGRLPSPASGALLVGGASALIVALWARGAARVLIAMLALAAIGSAVTVRANDGRARSPLSAAIAHNDAVVLTGVMTDDPSGPSYAASALVRVTVAGTHRSLLATANGDDAERFRVLEAGDRVTLRGRLRALGSSDFEQLARWRHAVGRLDGVTIESFAPPHGLAAIAGTARDEIIRGTRPLAPTPRALTAGFLLGDTRTVPPDVVAAYRGSGLSHLLAVSGENVAFALALFAPLLRRLPLGARTLLALVVVLVFATMTRFEPSVLRASAMAAIALLATFAGRPLARVRLLALAVITLLVADPYLLHSVAFLLSCGASAGIALAEPAIAGHLRGPRFVREPLAVSLAAQLGVTPVLLLTFGSVPVVTPLANLAAAPAAELIGVYGMLASGVAGVAPRLGPFVQFPTALLVGWVSLVARAGAAIPVRLSGRGALASIAIAAATASLRCLRARRPVPDTAPR
jgi:competence protein ComEC